MATILVVDDNVLNRSVLTTLLAYRGHRLVEAASGSEAIDKTLAEHPELIITDILSCGAEASLQKPVDNGDFLKAIEGALSKVGRPA